MTEVEWLASTDPNPMLDFLRDDTDATDRKLILVSCACGHAVSHLLADIRSRLALPIAERFADGMASKEEMEAVFQPACDAAAEAKRYGSGNDDGPPLPSWAAAWVIAKAVIATSTTRGEDAFFGAVDAMDFAESALRQPQTHLLRDVFGNPFRPKTIAPSLLTWSNSTVPRIAQRIYEERAFDEMPILGDSLESAGCVDVDILEHCRRPDLVHVRGCWLLDLLTNRR